jgi:hypothetical protein
MFMRTWLTSNGLRYQTYGVSLEGNSPTSSDVFWVSASNMFSPSFSSAPTLATQVSSAALHSNLTYVNGSSGYEMPSFSIQLLDSYGAKLPAATSTTASITAVSPSTALVFGTTAVTVSSGKGCTDRTCCYPDDLSYDTGGLAQFTSGTRLLYKPRSTVKLTITVLCCTVHSGL